MASFRNFTLLGVMTHTFYPSTWEVEAGISLEFEASLVYRVKKPFLKNQKQDNNNKINKTFALITFVVCVHVFLDMP